MTVQVHLFAAASAAIGQEVVTVDGAPGQTIRQCLDALVRQYPAAGTVGTTAAGADARRVLASCSYLVNGVATRESDTVLGDGDRLDVLPPFAGG